MYVKNHHHHHHHHHHHPQPHKYYNVLDCNWFKHLLFAINSLARLLSDGLLLALEHLRLLCQYFVTTSMLTDRTELYPVMLPSLIYL